MSGPHGAPVVARWTETVASDDVSGGRHSSADGGSRGGGGKGGAAVRAGGHVGAAADAAGGAGTGCAGGATPLPTTRVGALDKQFLLSADTDWTWDASAGVFTLYVSREVAALAAGDGALSASGGLYVDVTTFRDWGMVCVKQ